jgi:hypothetical protein
MTGKRIRKITVTAIGTSPPLPLRPLVDEVLRAMERQSRRSRGSGSGPAARVVGCAPHPPSRESLASWIQVRSGPRSRCLPNAGLALPLVHNGACPQVDELIPSRVAG